MATKPTIEPSLLRQLLRYEPVTGELIWQPRPLNMFPSKRTHKIWNTRYANKPAMAYVNPDGYEQGSLFGKRYRKHSVVWAIVNGVWPSKMLDHINGVRGDNRIVNLREVSPEENVRNAKKPSNNTSGHIGVCWRARCKKWRATVTVKRRSISLGEFKNFADAVAARKSAEVKYGFHKNHGRN